MPSDRLAAPSLPRDYDGGASDERRGSWVGDFDPARRTSFANNFLEEVPPEHAARMKKPLGAMHYVHLDEEADLMSTPPISPVITRHSKSPSSYFESPTQTRIGTKRSSYQRSGDEPEAGGQGSLFSTLFNKAFETVSKSGEALDPYSKDARELSDSRKAAKGKGRAINFDYDEEEDLPHSRPPPRPTSVQAPQNKLPLSNSPATTTPRESHDAYISPLEATLVNTLEAAEKKVSQAWAWLTDDSPVGPDYQK